MAESLLQLITEINHAIDDVQKLANNPESTGEDLSKKMATLEEKMDQMRTFPDDDWQQARNDILGLSANLDRMKATLTAEHEKSKKELSQISDRAKAQKSYAAYNQLEQTAPDATEETKQDATQGSKQDGSTR